MSRAPCTDPEGVAVLLHREWQEGAISAPSLPLQQGPTHFLFLGGTTRVAMVNFVCVLLLRVHSHRNGSMDSSSAPHMGGDAARDHVRHDAPCSGSSLPGCPGTCPVRPREDSTPSCACASACFCECGHDACLCFTFEFCPHTSPGHAV